MQDPAQSRDVTTDCVWALKTKGVNVQQRPQLEKLFQRRISVNGRKKGAKGKMV